MSGGYHASMNAPLPLDKMSLAEKLRAMEEIWEDLTRLAGDIASPAWHEDILRARQARVDAGQSTFVDWHEAKARIGEQR